MYPRHFTVSLANSTTTTKDEDGQGWLYLSKWQHSHHPEGNYDTQAAGETMVVAWWQQLQHGWMAMEPLLRRRALWMVHSVRSGSLYLQWP